MITSTKNAAVKHLLDLQRKSALRREEGLAVVEGWREVEHCLDAGWQIERLWLCPDIADAERRMPIEPTLVSRTVYERIAMRGGTEGIVAEVRPRHLALRGLRQHDEPLISVIESVEKPGNIGAILRTCDAAAVDALIVCDPLTDLTNPNLIRSSVGAVFHVPTVACTTAEAISFLRTIGAQIITAQLQDSSLYYDVDMRRATAIVMGTEATGLTEAWRQAADAHVRIPMLGRVDSLNVSVSASVLLYEAVRQRRNS